MNKQFKQVTDVRNESIDSASKIYRVINELSRQLDDQRARIHNVRELFRDNVEVLRMKLRDYCEKLMFLDPVNYGKKAEELLWKKSYYEIVATIKHLHKNRDLDEGDLPLVKLHLQAGLGRYHHLVMRLQTHYHLDLRGAVDAPITVPDRGLPKEKPGWSSLAVELGGLEWAHQAVVRCLVFLGDLSRYLVDIDPTRVDPVQAQRYYCQALSMRPEYGAPHNQLATMALGTNYNLDSAYHYMRSLCCKEKFEGAENNYEAVFEANCEVLREIRRPGARGDCDLKNNVKSLLIGFVHISYCLFYDKPFNQNEMYPRLVRDLEPCIKMLKSQTTTADCPTQVKKSDARIQPPVCLDEFMLFKMVVMMIMCVQRLKEKGSSMLGACTSWCVGICGAALEVCTARVAAAVGRGSEPATVPRRRRPRRPPSDDEDDDAFHGYTSGSDPGEEELIYDLCSNGDHLDVDEKIASGGRPLEHRKPWTHPLIMENKAFQQIHLISSQGYVLQTVKVIFDWWSESRFMMKPNGVISSSVDALVANFVCLMNQLSAVPSIKTINNYLEEGGLTEDEVAATPLPEDIALKGLAIFKSSQSPINWAMFTNSSLHPRQQTYIRICKLTKFGIGMSKSTDSPICYSEGRDWFYHRQPTQNHTMTNGSGHHIQAPINGVHRTPGNHNQGKEGEKLMKSMAAMWLKSEVSQLAAMTARPEPPAYLVVDSAALTQHSQVVRRLVQARRFVVIVPACVVAALDREKGRPGSRVRDTVRWIEAQVRQGSRFVRIQRPNEHAPIPFIKYPKKKDKDACMFIQMVECAYYLATQSTGDKNGGLVTLVMGDGWERVAGGFSPSGVAEAAGVAVAHVDEFAARWAG